MKVILHHRVIGPYINDRIIHLYKITAKRKVTVKQKNTFNLMIIIYIIG